jgi:hypothetical protein
MSYNLTLTGSTLEHSDRVEALAAFSSLFSINNSDAEKLLTIAPVVIKPDLSSEKAHALAKLVEGCGLGCVVESSTPTNGAIPAPVDEMAALNGEKEVPVVTQTEEKKGLFAKLKSIFKRD